MILWKRPHTWPNDFDKYTFLARAVHFIGKANFGEAWSETGHTEELLSLERMEHLKENELRRYYPTARALLLKYDPALRLPPGYPLFVGAPSPISPAQWELACQLAERHNAQVEDARERLEQTKKILLNWLVEGSVTAAIRDHEGGELKIIPKSSWNSESLDSRFISCKLDPIRQFKSVVDFNDPESSWIFISERDLNNKTSRDVHNVGSDGVPLDESYISDILEFTLMASRKFKDNLEEQLKKKALEDDLRALWRHHFQEEPTSGSVSAVATVLRSREAQKGTGSELRKPGRSQIKR